MYLGGLMIRWVSNCRGFLSWLLPILRNRRASLRAFHRTHTMHSLRRALRVPTSASGLRRLSSNRRAPPPSRAAAGAATATTGDDEWNDAWETSWLPGDSHLFPAPAAPWSPPPRGPPPSRPSPRRWTLTPRPSWPTWTSAGPSAAPRRGGRARLARRVRRRRGQEGAGRRVQGEEAAGARRAVGEGDREDGGGAPRRRRRRRRRHRPTPRLVLWVSCCSNFFPP